MSIQAAPPDYELVQEGDLWVAMHVETGVASQGDTPTEAVEMAKEASALASQEHHPGDDDYQQRMLRQCGIDPSDVDDEITDTPDGMP